MTPFHAASDDKPAKNDKADKPSGLAEQLAFKSRFVLVFGEIDDKLARTVCERLILLSQDSDAPINMLISSPGGHVESGDAIHDMIRFVRAPVTCIGTGWVASAATHIFLAAPKITLALSKGRIFDDSLPLLRAAGIEVLEDPEKSRKLIIGTSRPDVRVVLVRASDVPTYVEHGGADLGVAGLDVLLEHGSHGLYRRWT
jgi:hypothetical protein